MYPLFRSLIHVAKIAHFTVSMNGNMYICMEIHLKESYIAGNCTIFHRLFFMGSLPLYT